MWTTDIGRFDASNLGLLRIIFEVNLKLFDQKSTKKLLFVLRDFSEKDDNFERIRQTLETDMQKIWSEINKPERNLKSTLTDFFTFEYCALPSPKYENKAFHSSLESLRIRFNQTQPNNLFASTRNQNRVPMDAYSYYVN
jgi:hypothetical protein